jgi:hypothetical protein
MRRLFLRQVTPPASTQEKYFLLLHFFFLPNLVYVNSSLAGITILAYFINDAFHLRPAKITSILNAQFNVFTRKTSLSSFNTKKHAILLFGLTNSFAQVIF